MSLTLDEVRDQIAAENPDWTEEQIGRELAERSGAVELVREPAEPEPSPVDGDELPPGLRGRVKFPDDTKGHYVVVWAPKPKRGEGRPGYREIACVAAQDPDHAKKVVLEAAGRSPKPIAERGDVARWLIAQAENGGILLRAVPAMHWPRDVDTTGMERPEPVLTIG